MKPRIVVLKDIAPREIEPDDQQSLIRLCVHADLFEIEGLSEEMYKAGAGPQGQPNNPFTGENNPFGDQNPFTSQNPGAEPSNDCNGNADEVTDVDFEKVK